MPLEECLKMACVNPNRFLKMYQEEWAARADWCCKPYKDCSHPPVVKTDIQDIEVSAGDTVYWEVQPELSTYTGDYALFVLNHLNRRHILPFRKMQNFMIPLLCFVQYNLTVIYL